MIEYDPLKYPYTSKRKLVYSKRGMVCATQPLATQAGLDILKKGGNAVDAAIATAACLTVVEPTSNGLGGDAFTLFWKDGELHGLNSSGPSPRSISIEKIKEFGHEDMPKYGWPTVTVPGIPGSWAELSKKHGELPLIDVLQPAIDYAREGYPVSPTVGKYWKFAFRAYKQLEGEQYKHWFDTFALEGRAPDIGEMWRSEDHAKTLEEIGSTEAESFYRGKLADKIAEFSKEYNGFVHKEDLEDYSPEWVEPMSVDYRGYDIWELPPNGQGVVALIALKILNGMEFDGIDNVQTIHKQIESIKLAFQKGDKYITDPDFMQIEPKELLADDKIDAMRDKIVDTAIDPERIDPHGSGTVYLATADDEGNMVSHIQSNYMGFGSGLVVPGTGIALQNRGNSFSLDPGHVNSLEPKKRPFHTIIPGFITKDKKPIGPFGVMGGHMQPQGHVQVVSNMVDYDLNPQAALDRPRWLWDSGKKVYLEHSVPNELGRALSRKGHQIKYALHSGSFGRGQVIIRENDVYTAGTEPRADSHIAQV